MDPVVTADGFTYERIAIEDWLSRQSTSPMTGEALAHLHLTANYAVRAMCRRYLEENGPFV